MPPFREEMCFASCPQVTPLNANLCSAYIADAKCKCHVDLDAQLTSIIKEQWKKKSGGSVDILAPSVLRALLACTQVAASLCAISYRHSSVAG